MVGVYHLAHPTLLSFFYVAILLVTGAINLPIGVTASVGTNAQPTTCSVDPDQPHCEDPALNGESTGANNNRSTDLRSEVHAADDSLTQQKTERGNIISHGLLPKFSPGDIIGK